MSDKERNESLSITETLREEIDVSVVDPDSVPSAGCLMEEEYERPM